MTLDWWRLPRIDFHSKDHSAIYNQSPICAWMKMAPNHMSPIPLVLLHLATMCLFILVISATHCHKHFQYLILTIQTTTIYEKDQGTRTNWRHPTKGYSFQLFLSSPLPKVYYGVPFVPLFHYSSLLVAQMANKVHLHSYYLPYFLFYYVLFTLSSSQSFSVSLMIYHYLCLSFDLATPVPALSRTSEWYAA